MKKNKNKSKKNKFVLILILVLGISIGYAALASNLKINGTSKVSSATWNIHWENVQINENSVSTSEENKARITDEARTEVEYSVELSEPGDFYEFTVDAKNDGTLDAQIYSVESKYNDALISDENKLPEYISYTITYEDGTPIEAGNTLDHGQKQTYKVKILYREDIDASKLPQSNVTLDLKFKVEYRQKEKDSISDENKDVIKLTKRQVEDQITPGDEVEIGDGETKQKFLVVKQEDNDVILLTKFNIGTVATGLNEVKFMQYDYTPYFSGLCWGTEYHVDGGIASWRDNVPFAKNAYWQGKIGTTYTSDNIYDPTYTGEPVFDEKVCTFGQSDLIEGCDYSSDYGTESAMEIYLNVDQTPDNYSIAYYVENYKKILIDMGAQIESARILKKSEAESLMNNNLLNYVGSNSFWLSDSSLTYVWMDEDECRYDAQLVSAYLNSGTYYNQAGVRPVIVVSKDNIK